MSANEMPERIWAAPWHSRSDADAGIWQSNDPGNEVYALEYLRKDLCASGQVQAVDLDAILDPIISYHRDRADAGGPGYGIEDRMAAAVESAKAALRAALTPAPQPEVATPTAQEAVPVAWELKDTKAGTIAYTTHKERANRCRGISGFVVTPLFEQHQPQPQPQTSVSVAEAVAATEAVLICAQEMCRAGHPVSALNVATDALRALKGGDA